MPVRVIDANSHLRRALETDTTGLTLRTIAAEARHGDVFVWDGVRSLEWRREIYPRYKEKREPAAENVYACLNLLKQVLRHTPAIQVEVPCFEADDVIASIVRRIGPCEVLTADWDLKQLETIPGVVVRSKAPKSAPPILPSFIRFYKTLVGDASDRIAGVPGFGPKAWASEPIEQWACLIQELEDGSPLNAVERRVQLMDTTECFRRWLSLEANRAELLAMWTVVGLADLPDDLIDRCTVAGVPDPGAADRLLREFLQ